jgi:hypothetical protein
VSVEQRTRAGQRPRPGNGPVGDHEDSQPADRAVGPHAGHRLAFDVDDKVAVPWVEARCDRGQPRPIECPGVGCRTSMPGPSGRAERSAAGTVQFNVTLPSCRTQTSMPVTAVPSGLVASQV